MQQCVTLRQTTSKHTKTPLKTYNILIRHSVLDHKIRIVTTNVSPNCFAMPAITFTPELHHRPNELGRHALMIRMTQNRKHKRKEVGYEIEKRHWNPKKKQVRSSHSLHVIINAAIAAQKKELEKKYLELLPSNPEVAMSEITEPSPVPEDRLSYTDFFNNFVDGLKNANTAAGMRTTINKLSRHKAQVYFDEIDGVFINTHREHLTSLGNNQTTVSLDLSYMRRVYNEAMKRGVYIPKGMSPFWNMTLKNAKFTRTKLKTEQIEDIHNLDLSVFPAIYTDARNVFLCCYYLLGVRISSMLSMRWSNIHGNRCIYAAAKGQKKMDAIITKKAQEILELYRTSESTPDDFIFPFIQHGTIVDFNPRFRQTMKNKVKLVNKYLDEIAKMLGYDFKITTHVARASFAYNARRLSGGDIYAVKKALGHSSIQTTERYFSSDETIEADNLANLMFD